MRWQILRAANPQYRCHGLELVAQWETSLQQLAGEFMAGEAAVNPQPGACDYCDLASLCRINEMSAGADPAAFEESA